MDTTVVRRDLMHSAVNTGSAYWAWYSLVIGVVGSILRVVSVPCHSVLARVSGNLVHVVV